MWPKGQCYVCREDTAHPSIFLCDKHWTVSEDTLEQPIFNPPPLIPTVSPYPIAGSQPPSAKKPKSPLSQDINASSVPSPLQGVFIPIGSSAAVSALAAPAHLPAPRCAVYNCRVFHGRKGRVDDNSLHPVKVDGTDTVVQVCGSCLSALNSNHYSVFNSHRTRVFFCSNPGCKTRLETPQRPYIGKRHLAGFCTMCSEARWHQKVLRRW